MGPRGPPIFLNSPKGAHVDLIKSHTHNVHSPKGTSMNQMEHELNARSYEIPHKLRARLYRIRMGPLMFFKKPKSLSRAHADLIKSHTRSVHSPKGTSMNQMEHEPNACSYEIPHELRVHPIESAWVLEGFKDAHGKRLPAGAVARFPTGRQRSRPNAHNHSPPPFSSCPCPPPAPGRCCPWRTRYRP